MSTPTIGLFKKRAPTTEQEWTTDRLEEYVTGLAKHSWSELAALARAINESIAAEREKGKGALHHMEACRALLNVPDDEVLYEAIQQLRSQLAAAEGDKERWRLACNSKSAHDRIKELEQQLAAAEAAIVNHNTKDEHRCSNFIAYTDTAALDAAIAEAKNEGWNEGREHERKCNAAEQQPERDARIKLQRIVANLVDALKHLQWSNHGYKPESCPACSAGDAALAKVGK